MKTIGQLWESFLALYPDPTPSSAFCGGFKAAALLFQHELDPGPTMSTRDYETVAQVHRDLDDYFRSLLQEGKTP